MGMSDTIFVYDKNGEVVNNIDGRHEEDDIAEVEANRKANRDSSYEGRIKNALEDLKANAGQYLTPAGLTEYSPKFLALYENIVNKSAVYLRPGIGKLNDWCCDLTAKLVFSKGFSNRFREKIGICCAGGAGAYHFRDG